MKEQIYCHVEIPRWLNNLDFDHKPVNSAILKEARAVRRVARRLVARKAISNAGEFPGKKTGALMRSIKIKSNKKFLFATIRPEKTAEMIDFYPAMLFQGTKRRLQKLKEGEGRGVSNRRRRGNRVLALAERASSSTFIIEKRGNYMIEALSQRRYAAREAIASVVKASLIAR